MKTTSINFKCPDCGESQLIEKRNHVQVQERVQGFLITDKSNPGRKFNLSFGSMGMDGGKVVGYACACCGYTLMTRGQDSHSYYWNPAEKRPIVSASNLHAWLKREGMLTE